MEDKVRQMTERNVRVVYVGDAEGLRCVPRDFSLLSLVPEEVGHA